MKGDERTATIARREFGPEIDRQIVGGPMARECRHGCAAFGTEAHGLAAVAAVFGRKHELVLMLVEIAFRPAVVGAGRKFDQLLRRQFGTLLGRVEGRPVLEQLVAPVLCSKQAAGRIEGEAFAVADAARIALGGREDLSRLVGIVAPGAAAGFLLHARLGAAHARNTVLRLAGVGDRAEIDEELALRVDHEGMHRMIARERQAGQHDGRGAARRELAR